MPELNKYDKERFDFINNALKLCFNKPVLLMELRMLRDENAFFQITKTLNWLCDKGFMTKERVKRSFNYYTSHVYHMPIEQYESYDKSIINIMLGKEKAEAERVSGNISKVVNGVVIPMRRIIPMNQFADKYREADRLKRLENSKKRTQVHIGGTFGMML